MRANRLVLALLTCCAVLSAGCATVANGPSFSEARAVQPMQGKAIVYIYRKYAEPTAWGATIHFGPQEVSTLNQGGFTWAYLEPGKYSVRAVWSGLSGQRDSSIDMDIKADNTYYLEVTGVSKLVGLGPPMPGFIVLRIRLGSGVNEVDPKSAEAVISECCKFQKPRLAVY